jgi:hypothetical protein
MDKQTATQLIGDTFNYPFDEGRFRNFAINLLNDVNEQKGFDYLSGTYIRHSFKNHITKYRRLGTYTDPNGEKIDVLVVQLKNEWALERSRTMLRNFTSDYLKNRDEKDAALVAYYTTNPDDWRFSYIRMEYKRVQDESGKFKIKEDLTPAKRYSYLVGKNEPNHTAQAQLVDILADDRNNPTLSDLETAFSVDAIIKQFYKDYRDQFEKLWNELNDIVKKDPKIAQEFETKTIDTANFAKKLMGQIVFLYFLQKKGWLGVGKDESGNFKEWGTGPKNFLHRLFKKEFTDYGNFFNDVLEPLFYEALATERTNDVFTRFKCKIPFLNGGLFEPINDYNWEETDIRIDNDLIAEVFKTFDQYNFTVREDEPLEKEVAVDPEMLGKVFENLLPENLRKGKGAYYTPRTIVHYMCQESLINYLDTACEAVPKADLETLIREGDIILELETAIAEDGKKYQPVLMDSIKENAPALDEALATIKVCDPAIGSGAFPVGMLTEIVRARKVLELYLHQKQGIYDLKRHCIQNSLYGVDLDPGAIEIAKLRLWLSLVVDEDDYQKIQALPNLDYKIMQGNSLIEEFHGISLDIEKKSEPQIDMFSGGSDLDALIDELHQKQADFFNAEHPREKTKKRQKVETAIYSIFHHELKKQQNVSPEETQKIETDLKEMTHGNRERNFFPWKLYFADVFREKGGFDVVIANPPYITLSLGKKQKYFSADEIENLRNIYKEVFEYKGNTFALFLLVALKTTIINGSSVFIIPNTLLLNKTFSKIRNSLLSNSKIKTLINFKSKVFVNAEIGGNIIIQFQKSSDAQDSIISFSEVSDIKNFPVDIFYSSLIQSYYDNFEDDYKIRTNLASVKVLKKLNDDSIPLVNIVDFYQGIITGNNKAYLSEKLVNEKYRPILRGKDIQKYCYYFDGNYVLYDKELLWSNTNEKNFSIDEKIISRQTSDRLIAAYDNQGYFTLDSTHVQRLKNSNFDLKYILALFNSKLINYYYTTDVAEEGRVFAQVKIINLKKIPVKNIDKKDQEPLIAIINNILTAKKSNPEADTTHLESEIDQLVYELYGLTEEEIAIVEESVK